MILKPGVRTAENPDKGDYSFWCPACGNAHDIWTTHPPGFTGPTWNFNGDMDKPSFSPSIKITGNVDYHGFCHIIITDGVLNYCADSGHPLAGKSVPMVNYD